MSTPLAQPSPSSTSRPRIASTRLSEEPSTVVAWTTPTVAPLPSPATFDILAPLHELLSRLLSTDAFSVNDDPSVSASQQPAPPDSQNKQALTVQQLAGEMSTIRSRIRHARRAVSELPDVGRTVDEQEQEMRNLKTRIEQQKDILKQLTAR